MPDMQHDSTHVASWFLYVLETSQGMLYTGISTDVDRRVREHETGRGARSLRGKTPLKLRWSLEVGERSLALRAEHRFKRWPRTRKLAMLEAAPPLDVFLQQLGL